MTAYEVIYAYTRVSTERQGESLDVQERTVAGYAMMLGLSVDRTFVERAVSGSKPLAERPEGSGMLAALKSGDTIITAKLDRMFRSAVDALANLDAMKRRGVHLHMIDLGGDVTGNGIAKLVFTILSAVAEAERDRIRERIAVVKADQKARGRYLGGPRPFGYTPTPDGFLEPLLAEQDAIAMMLDMRADGATLRTIAAAVCDQGLSITAPTVNHLLNRAKIATAGR